MILINIYIITTLMSMVNIHVFESILQWTEMSILDSPFLKITEAANVKQMEQRAYMYKNTNIRNGSEKLMTAPLGPLTMKSIVMTIMDIRRKRAYLTNQDTHCNQLFKPIIFISSYNHTTIKRIYHHKEGMK